MKNPQSFPSTSSYCVQRGKKKTTFPWTGKGRFESKKNLYLAGKGLAYNMRHMLPT